MRTALPVTFRRSGLAARRAQSEACWREGMDLVARLESACGIRGAPLEWCNGYQLGLSRTELRASPLAEAAAVQRWLVRSCDSGLVVRQEMVSMLPAVMAEIQPNDTVLDMCAAPGSKTAQLVETISHSPTGGLVVANDVNPLRAYVLAHRLKNLTNGAGAPLNMIVVSHRGQRFPRLGDDGLAIGVGPFDKVLCDVPCSGDGTLRKEPSLWGNWRPGLGLALHSLQLQLATRAASLLKVGGTLAYSTCSLNPIEDEAVVSALLAASRGALELVDGSALLPQLRRKAGMTRWHVIDDQNHLLQSYQQARKIESSYNSHGGCRFRATMWPPPPASAPPLERCMRFLPHLSGSGGFFIALLKKVAPLPAPRRKPREAVAAVARVQRDQRLAAARADGHVLRPLQPAELVEVQSGLDLLEGALEPMDQEEPRLFTRSPLPDSHALGRTVSKRNTASGKIFALSPRVAHILSSYPGRLCVVHAGSVVARKRRMTWEEVDADILRGWRKRVRKLSE
mmetsp:Transcript_31298/g.95724  ORF Transcript_31298/g.95724 Transcript_31298/m.95724 type:complete len:511 (+) Transcript_31298:788-2320(+)